MSAVFWDIGGVLLTNGWDRYSRADAAKTFGIDHAEFEGRHQSLAADFDAGRLSLDEYLHQAIFYQPRKFDTTAFQAFMFDQSRPHPEVINVAKSVRDTGRYLMGMLNNEPLELNLYRIQKFGLRGIFTVFISSCFVGLRKPDPAIYRLALELTQKDAGEVILVDDRQENVSAAIDVGMRTILHDGDAVHLRRALEEHGVAL